MTSEPELSVVLPGYNERDALEEAVARYREALHGQGLDEFEILLVDDASTDGTQDLCRQLASQDPRVRVLRHPENRGQVAAILTGFGEARGRFVTHNGMDLPFDPADTLAVLDHLRGGADVVVVERCHRASYGLVRKVLSWCNILLLRALFETPFLDHNFVQFFRRSALAELPVRSRGVSTVTLELVLRALRGGLRVVGTSAEYHQRRVGRSSITPGKAIHALLETLRLWWLLRAEPPA